MDMNAMFGRVLGNSPSVAAARSQEAHSLPQEATRLIAGIAFVVFGLLTIVRWEPAFIDVFGPPAAILLGVNIVRLGPLFTIDRRFAALLVALIATTIVNVQTITSPTGSIQAWLMDPFGSPRYWATTVLVMVLGVFAHLVGQRHVLVRAAFTGLIGISTMVMLASIAGFFGVLPLADLVSASGGVRLQGLSKNPNAMGNLAVVLLIVALDGVLNKRSASLTKLPTWFLYLSVGVNLSAVFLSFSRSAWGAMAMSVTLLVALSYSGRVQPVAAHRLVLSLAAGAASLVVMYRYAPAVSVDYIARKFGQDLADNPRVRYQEEALSRFWEHPILGHGARAGSMEMGLGAHNAYITQLHDYGIVGFLLLLFVMIPPLMLSLRYALASSDAFVKRLASVYAAVLASQYAVGFAMDFIHQRHVWLFIGLGWALPLLARSRSSSAERDAPDPSRTS